jgi:hypothetical protein
VNVIAIERIACLIQGHYKLLSHRSWRGKTHTNFGCAGSLATLDKLKSGQRTDIVIKKGMWRVLVVPSIVDKFPLPPVAPPIGDTSLTRVMRLAAHSTTSPTPTAMR